MYYSDSKRPMFSPRTPYFAYESSSGVMGRAIVDVRVRT
jgi:hypothetical protein